MNKDKAMAEAKAVSAKENCRIVVVNDAITNAEELDGTYGYCPMGGETYLFKFGTVEAIFNNGELVNRG